MPNHKPHNTMNSNAQIRTPAAGEPAFRLRRPRLATGIPRICIQIHEKFIVTFDMCKYGVMGSY